MQFLIKSSSGKESRAEAETRALDPGEKRRNALKALGFCWLLSLVTLPLPPIHWVTVPFFFFFGFYLAARKFREGVYSERFAFSCPECGGKVEVGARPLAPAWEAICPACKFVLRLSTVNSR